MSGDRASRGGNSTAQQPGKRRAQGQSDEPAKLLKIGSGIDGSVLPDGVSRTLKRHVEASAEHDLRLLAIDFAESAPGESGESGEPDEPDDRRDLSQRRDPDEKEREEEHDAELPEVIDLTGDEAGEGESEEEEEEEGEPPELWPVDERLEDDEPADMTMSGLLSALPGKQIEELRLRYIEQRRPAPAIAYIDPRLGSEDGARLFKYNTRDAIRGLDLAKSVKKVTVNQVGRWMEHGYASGAADMIARRDRQLLNQLCQLLLDHVRRTATTEEIQAMVINGRILVSINERKNVGALSAVRLDRLLDPANVSRYPAGWRARKAHKLASLVAALALPADADLPEQDAEAGPDSVESYVLAGVERLSRVELDCALIPEQREAVKAILAALRNAKLARSALVRGGTPQQAAELIGDEGHRGKVIVVDAVPESRAEQNLVCAAAKSEHGLAGPITIAGGKRPCTVCWLTLSLARGCGMDLRFNPHPGGYWETSPRNGLFMTARELGFTRYSQLAGALVAACGETKFQQYVTSLGAGAAQRSPVKLVEAVLQGTYSTETSTPSQSPDHY